MVKNLTKTVNFFSDFWIVWWIYQVKEIFWGIPPPLNKNKKRKEQQGKMKNNNEQLKQNLLLISCIDLSKLHLLWPTKDKKHWIMEAII